MSTTRFLSIDLDVHYGFVDLSPVDEHVEDQSRCRGGQVNGLCGATVPGVLAMVTGLHTGSVPFEIAVLDAEPAVSDEWEEVVEVSFTARQRDYWLTAFEDGAYLTLPTATSYRARYCATGMDEAHECCERSPEEPVIDRYLLQLWPAPVGEDAVLRQTSEAAAYWHEVARTTPPPPPPPTAEQRAAEAALEAERQAQEEAAFWHQMEIEDWGGSLPSEALRSGGAAAQQLAHTHRRLADEIAALDPATLRQVAHWAASTACERAGDAALDWRPALDALGQGAPLPPPFDDPIRAWTTLYGPLDTSEMEIISSAEDHITIHAPAAALATILAAADPNPTAAAFDAIQQAASGVDDPEIVLSAVQHQFKLS